MADAPRWVEVTSSPFPHAAEGLAVIRTLLPQTSPYRAWSNVEFRDGQGKWHEVDLIVLGQRRLHLVELKYYSGTLRGDDLRWLRDGHRAEDSPLKLARRKAQRLASKLRDELLRWAQETGTQVNDVRDIVPFVQESVFLHHPGLRCVLSATSRVDLFGLDGRERTSGLPGISTRLLEPSTTREVIGANREAILADLMSRIGLVQRRQREVGSWMIDDEPLDEGVGWQDWPASHRLAASRRVRIRVRVTAPGAPTQEVARVRKVVEHEYRIMSRLAHDGLLQPLDFVDDELGVGLVYPYDESFQRLDLWQADRPHGVPLPDQLALLRQVAEAVQAPEGGWNSGADRVRLDVFALGALAYFVLAGRPPAPDRASLRERLQRDGGLDLAADLPQVSSALRNLVREATRPSVSDRLPDVTAFLDRLAQAECATGTTEDVSDPLEALAGDVVADRWQ